MYFCFPCICVFAIYCINLPMLHLFFISSFVFRGDSPCILSGISLHMIYYCTFLISAPISHLRPINQPIANRNTTDYIRVCAEAVFKNGQLFAPFTQTRRLRDEAFGRFWIEFTCEFQPPHPSSTNPESGASALSNICNINEGTKTTPYKQYKTI